MYNVAIFVFDGVELLDFAGPYEVFSDASELFHGELFRVFTVARDTSAVSSVNGLRLLPDFGFDAHPPADVLVLPGGIGTKAEMKKKTVLAWIKKQHANTKITMSVCSGARLLGKAGLLDGVECTTHHEVIGDLKEIAPGAVISADKRLTESGRLYTSAGISAGIDLSLHLVEKLYGKCAADKTRAYMEYGDWKERG